ncbi:LytTR family DNA-binding domain-containing protein [Maribacter polysiphoniae]|uniref:LytTR family DNA-binding domain-containing protein n=1 Tax=Maribacter polysiphoniae TaxID=429344 RepID=UPI0023526500|nr:LytTR family DNA-binding domain-containing protein [Maribacter polysiphoniae]
MKKAAKLYFEKNQVPESVPTNSVAIKTQVKSDDFMLNPLNLIYAKSDGNYTEIHILKEEVVEKSLKRISIKELELQLNSVVTIVRTHRSYLVNINYLVKVTGNAQGYRLHLKKTDDLVPVSRNMIAQFEEHTKTLNTSA